MFKTAKTRLLKIFTKVDGQGNSLLRYPDFGPLEIQNYEEFLHSSKTFFNSLWKKPVKYTESLESFEIIEFLGEGMFSEVLLVKHLEKEEFYAMKVLEKEKVVRNKHVLHALNEKLVLQGLNNPFTVYLVSFFMDNCHLYFVLPFVPCGELFKYLSEMKKFGEQQTRFYVAQIVLALEYLHCLELVYRDLKPENVLIDHLGYLKLTDFGFCKRVKGRTYTFCGTPQYLSPEVVLGVGYSGAVDWWALGVFTFELSVGRSPFNAEDLVDLFESIVDCRYRMEPSLSVELKHFIMNLLQKDLTKRMGNLKGGVMDIKDHTWLRPINWLAVLNRKVLAEFLPENESITRDSVDCLKTKPKLYNTDDSEDKFGKVFINF